MTSNIYHLMPPSDEEAALHQIDERLQRAGAPLRERPIATDRFIAQLHTLAAQERLNVSVVPLQEEFTLMNSAHIAVPLSPQPARWRVIISAIAAVLLIIIGSFAVFQRAHPASHPITATPTYAHLPSGTFSTFATGSYGPLTLTMGGDGNLWFTAITAPFTVPSDFTRGPTVVGMMTHDGVYRTFALPTLGLAAGETRTLSAPGTAGVDGATWFPVSVVRASLPERMEIAKVSAQGQFSLYRVPRFVADGLVIRSMVRGSDGNVWFIAQTVSSSAVMSGIGKISPTGIVTWMPQFHLGVLDAIAAGPDGNLWFENDAQLARLTPQGTLTLYPLPAPGRGALIFDAQNHLWVLGTLVSGNVYRNDIQRFDLATHVTMVFTVSDPGPLLLWLGSGPSGSVWLLKRVPDRDQQFALFRVNPDGTLRYVFQPITSTLHPTVIDGRDGNLWFIDDQQTGTDHYTGSISRLTP